MIIDSKEILPQKKRICTANSEEGEKSCTQVISAYAVKEQSDKWTFDVQTNQILHMMV